MPRILSLIFILISTQGFAQQAHNVRLLCNWFDTTNAPANGSGQHWNDVWGFTMHGREYGVIGGTNGAHIIDVATCQERAFARGRSQGVVHRDYKTYRNYLYAVADEGYASLQVYDLSYLPDSVHLVFEDRQQLTRAHTIFIDTAKARLYACGTTDMWGSQVAIRKYSLVQPDKPEFTGVVNDVIYTHSVYARNDTVWCSNAFEGFRILDMTGRTGRTVIGGLIDYPDKGYNHSAWIGYDGIGVMADETFGKRVKVIDVRDPEQVEVLSTFAPKGNDTMSIAHNPYLLGRSAIVSWYMDGLQIYDLSDPRNPVQSGYFKSYTGPDKQDYLSAWGAYPYLPSRQILMSDMQQGLYVLDASAALSVAEQKTLQLLIVPNPVTGPQPLRIFPPEHWAGTVTVQIRDMSGRTLLNQAMLRAGNAPLQVSLPADWPEGVYLLQVGSPAGLIGSRILKR